MIKDIFKILILVALAAFPAMGATLDLGNNGVISGHPGDLVGWAYQLTNDDAENWLVVSYAVFYDGSDTDQLNSLAEVVLAPGASTMWQYYTGGLTGLSNFLIPADAEGGWVYGGFGSDIELDLDFYDSMTFNPTNGTWTYGTWMYSDAVYADAQVDVAPEPATGALVAWAGLLLLAVFQRRRA